MKTLLIFQFLWCTRLCYADEFINGNVKFSAQAYANVYKKQLSFVISPFSIQTVLAMAQSGANGETGKEIRSVLKFPNSKRKVEEAFKKCLPILTKSSETFIFKLASRVYVNSKFSIKPGFNRVVSSIYRGSAENMDFSIPSEAVDKINKWVEKETSNKIQKLLNTNNINSETAAVLVNAVYSFALWDKEFPLLRTTKKSFYTISGETVQVDTMTQLQFFRYRDDRELDATFLQMDLKDRDDATVVFVLPNKRNGLESLEKQMSKVLRKKACKKVVVNATIPKFKIEFTTDFKIVLARLGMRNAISSDADFSNIAGDKGDLRINYIVQKCAFEIDELGVEASAASSGGGGRKEPNDKDVKYFIADHPFIFYFRVSNIITFVGRVTTF